jgi:hypothetical protein
VRVREGQCGVFERRCKEIIEIYLSLLAGVLTEVLFEAKKRKKLLNVLLNAGSICPYRTE